MLSPYLKAQTTSVWCQWLCDWLFMFQEIFSSRSWVHTLSLLRGKRGWKHLRWKTVQNRQALLGQGNFRIFAYLWIFLTCIWKRFISKFCVAPDFFCTTLWKKMSLEHCLPNQRFNFNLLVFHIVKNLHMFSLFLFCSRKSSDICGFFLMS